MNKLFLNFIFCTLLISFNVRAQDSLAINSSVHYQTIEGWGHGGGILGFLGGAESMLDSSIANPVNYQTLDFITSELGLTGSRTWEVGPRVDGTGIDSGGNCDVIDWSKFQSNTLSWQDAQYLIYFKNRVNSQGYQTSFYSSPGYPSHATGAKPWIVYHPGERALQLWSSALYMKNTYGLDINYAVMQNEPASPYTSAVLSDDIKASGARFASHGLATMAQFAEAINPQIDWNLISPVDSDATLWPYVGRLSYHNYGTADPYRSQIRDFGLFKGIRTAQTEMGTPGFDDLYADLTLGGVSYWEVGYSGNSTLVPSAGLTSFTPSAYYIRLRQVMHYVRPGAILTGTTGNDALLEVLSFTQGSAITTVIDNKNSGSKTVYISGLPAGTYGLSSAAPGVTTFQEYGVRTVTATGTLTVTANGGGTITTLYPHTVTNMPPTIMTWGTSPGYVVAPATSATLTATASDPEATALTYQWTLVSSPAGSTPVISTPTALTTVVTGLSVAGTYVFNIAASDGVNISSKKVYLCVYSENPQPVLGSAGFRIAAPYGLVFSNQGDTTHANIELPTSAVTLQIGISDLANSDFTGRGTWTLVSQPAGGVAVVGATTYIFISIRADVTGMTVPGDYVFQVNVTNPGHPDLTMRIICTVRPATSAPTISPITPFASTITLPVSSDLLTATTTDTDGSILRHWWEISSVPTGAYPVFDHQGLPVATVSNLTIPGTYTFTLRCFDDLHMTTRNVTITVLPAVGAISGPSSVCAGSSITLSDASTGGTWSSSNPTVGTVGSSSGIVSGITPGTTTISYTVSGSPITTIITVNPLPNAGVITGTTTVCGGSTTPLTDAASGGLWSSGATGIATVIGTSGVVTGISTGTATISYTVTTSCGSAFATATVTVNPLPIAGTITGAGTLCAGSAITLSDATAGGVWSSGATGIATVGSTGIVTSVSTGTAIISYSVTNGCGIAFATTSITVNPLPVAGTITGGGTVCAGSAITLSDATAGGVWSSSATGVVTVGSTGTVTGIGTGMAIISYSVTNGCGIAFATATVTVNPLPVAGTITGGGTVCAGSAITLSDATAGGVWSSGATGIATMGSTGIVTGVSTGTAIISYSVTNGCGIAFATATVTVNPLPVAGTITGAATVCAGSAITLSDAIAGGVWSSGSTGVATVGSTGIVTGVGTGTAIISYSVTNGCGIAFATATVTVSSLPVAGTITGPTTVCNGSSITLTDAVSGGVWTSGATVIATVSTAGVVTGTGPGTVTISYTVSGCGSATASYTVTVNSIGSAGTISGTATMCSGSTTALTDAVSGGSWSSSNTLVATAASTGVITGVSAGTAGISYAISGSCGTAYATRIVTVSPSGSAGIITGPATVCNGSSITLSDLVSGGVWSSGAMGVAIVSISGVVTGASLGTATISYTVSSCGSATATYIVTVTSSVTAGTITGIATACPGSTTNLTDAVGGGNWSSGNTLVATVGSTTGIVIGVAAGTATIYYSVSNSCGTATANRIVTVNASSNAGTITGTAGVCIGLTTSLTDAVTGGTWSSVSPGVATVGSTGVVTGVATGTSTISYSVTNSCGTTTAATRTVTVNSAPVAWTITGTTSVCGGSTTALTDAAGGGVWSSSAVSIATVSTGGVVTGIAIGTATISYTVTNSCGTATATVAVTVTGSSAGSITGASTVITGTTTYLTDAISGGIWSASNGNASVSASGVVTGVTPGTVTISYTMTSGCGSLSATKLMTVNNATSVAPISGYYFYLCAGATANFWDATTGGSWSISPASVATVSATGVVTGISAGIATLTYTYGGLPVTVAVTVNAAPVAITGTFITCVGTTAALADATPGGTWSSGSTTIATISTAGVVSGVMVGTSTIYYTGAGGCKASQVFTVSAVPSGIGGASSVCTGSSVSLSDLTGGGAWSSTAPASVVGTGTATALATGLTTGTAVITYSLGTGCYRTFNLTVKPVPAPVSGTLTVCVGSVGHLSDATTPGISWTSSNTFVATISASGGATGISAGMANMTYTASNGCIASATITVNALPVVAAIAGASTLSHGGGATLYTDATGGGVWSSTHATVISIGSSSGIAAAIASSGTTTISYTVTDASGCVAAATKNVAAAPAPREHGGSTTTVVGAVIGIADESTGGDWISSDNHIAVVDKNGTVSALAAGNVNITHIVVNSDGILDTYTTTLVVNALLMEVRMIPNPNAGTFTITGTTGSGKDETVAIAISNMLGQLVYGSKLIVTAGMLNEQIMLSSSLANGMYLLNVNSESGNKVFHFVVEK